MQDLPLSRLSRGCGRLVSSSRNSGRHDGRLDVCFTPQDYYMWRYQETLLRLSNSLEVETESTLPKTYSTRRGHLLLYSQHLVSMERSRRSENRQKKQRAARRYRQQVEQQLSTLKDLTAAILNYSSRQFISSRPSVLPPLNLPAASRSLNTKQQQLGPERNTKQPENQSEDKEDQLTSGRRVSLDLYLQIPRTSGTSGTSRIPTTQIEPQLFVQPATVTPEEPENPQTNLDKKHHSTGEFHDRNKSCSSEKAGDGGCQDRSDKDNCGRSMSGSRRSRTGQILPPLNVGHTVCPGPSKENSVGVGGRPPAKSWTVGSGRQDDQPQSAEVQFHLQENPKRCHQQPHFLPLLFPGREEDLSDDKQREGKVKPETRHVRSEPAERQGGRWFSSNRGSVILLQPGEAEPRPPAAPSGSVAGRRGPGRQSSLAFLQNLQNPSESGDASRGVVRGLLPLQLRDLQSGRPVGSLILGPDGEIIRLSLFDNNKQDQTEAVQVVSADGQELPWFILLQPKHTLTEAEDEEEQKADDTVGDVHQLQSIHKLLDVLRSPEADSSSSYTDSDVKQKQTQGGAEAVTETWRKRGNDTKSRVRMNPLMEQREDNTEEEEDLPPSPGSGWNINPPKAAAEEPVDQTQRRQNSENPAETTGKKNMKTVKSVESDEPKRMRRERRQKTESDNQTKQEEKTNRDEETLDRSVLKTVKKKMREGLRGDMKVNEEMMKEEVMKEEEESAERKKRRKRRRERPTELHVGVQDAALQKEEPEETPHLKSSPAAKNNNTNSEERVDRLPANDSIPNNLSSVQSARSLRSVSNQRSLRRSAASSCDWPMAAAGLTSSHGRLSSCSTVMVTEEQLMLNPVKPESSRLRQSQELKLEEEEVKVKMKVEQENMEDKGAVALHQVQRAERKRQEVERKRRQEEEAERKRRQREQTEERMKTELQEERRRRTEELRLKKLEEEEERRRKVEEEQHRAKREEEQRESERRKQQEEKRRKMERLKRMREEEEQRRRAELERRQLEDQTRQQQEKQKLQEMDEDERKEYLRKKEEEEEEARRRGEERRLRQELINRQMALLQQQLAFKRALLLEAGGLQKTQSVSRPWIYSYFTLLQLLGLRS